MASWLHKFISAVFTVIGISTNPLPSAPPPTIPTPTAPATSTNPAPTAPVAANATTPTVSASETLNFSLVEIISLLKGNGLTHFADGLEVVQDVVMRHSISGGTIFAPEYPGFEEFSEILLTQKVREYIVEGRFEFKDLAALPFKTVLKTLNVQKDLEITTAFNATTQPTVSIEGAVVTKPDVCSNIVFVVHAISRPF